MTNLEILETLGLELRRRGRDWRSYLPPLRILYAHTRAGTTPAREEWPLEHALDLAGLLGIGPNPWPLRPWNSACPHCPASAAVPQHFGGMRKLAAGVLIDRTGERCLLCGFCWAEPRANFVFSKADRRVHDVVALHVLPRRDAALLRFRCGPDESSRAAEDLVRIDAS